MISPVDNRCTPEPISPTAWLATLTVILATFEGAFRKWVFPDSGAAVQGLFYFAKDVTLLCAAAFALQYGPRSSQVQHLRQCFLLMAILIGGATLLNLTNTRLVGGVVSARSMVVVPWLALLVVPGLRSEKDLEVIVKTVGVLAIGEAALGVTQFYLPAGHILNRQVSTASEAVEFQSHVRASGTFAFLQGMSNMALIASWAGSYLVLTRPRRIVGYVFVLAGLSCTAAAISRSGMFPSLILVASVSLLSVAQMRYALVLSPIIAAIWLAMSYNPSSNLGPSWGSSESTSIWNAVFQRHGSSDTVAQRASSYVSTALRALETPLGNGLGVGQTLADVDVDAVSGRRRALSDSEVTRIILELGVIGLIAVIGGRLAVVVVLWRSLAVASRYPRFVQLRRVSLVAVALFFVHNVAFDHVACTFAWVIATVALATFEIEATQHPADCVPA
jgi:hypothetical protein